MSDPRLDALDARIAALEAALAQLRADDEADHDLDADPEAEARRLQAEVRHLMFPDDPDQTS